ncbi:uncharacterized protein LOC119953391 isoform X2 [Scyliorhinus canicula]|uniref:uncharacterized protein LOC119953391 isoform X2 n=1 Tax=Scyliorhinus canicula TaxID=7830 RepID=UPI0018F50C00|nr:uncharacterized protein LOC119953391 isoform X2 [Scyliorhinus canicula]
MLVTRRGLSFSREKKILSGSMSITVTSGDMLLKAGPGMSELQRLGGWRQSGHSRASALLPDGLQPGMWQQGGTPNKRHRSLWSVDLIGSHEALLNAAGRDAAILLKSIGNASRQWISRPSNILLLYYRWKWADALNDIVNLYRRWNGTESAEATNSITTLQRKWSGKVYELHRKDVTEIELNSIEQQHVKFISEFIYLQKKNLRHAAVTTEELIHMHNKESRTVGSCISESNAESLFCVFPESLVCLEMFCKDVLELSEELYKNSVCVLESNATVLPDPDQEWWKINLPDWMQYISGVLPALEDTIISIRNITHQFLEYFKTTSIACSLKSHPDVGYYVSDYGFKEAYLKKVWCL